MSPSDDDEGDRSFRALCVAVRARFSTAFNASTDAWVNVPISLEDVLLMLRALSQTEQAVR